MPLMGDYAELIYYSGMSKTLYKLVLAGETKRILFYKEKIEYNH